MRNCRQPLREAVSWNNPPGQPLRKASCRQPLREAVSWNILCKAEGEFHALVSLFVRLWVEICPASWYLFWSLSASSWGCELKFHFPKVYDSSQNRQPLREAVSWNINISFFSHYDTVSLFVRLWVEISFGLYATLNTTVSLFVRLWVEISVSFPRSFACSVSLFVRLWVEMLSLHPAPARASVSLFVRLWVEIGLCQGFRLLVYSQPLREAVSWNINHIIMGCDIFVSLFVRLWVEIHLPVLRQILYLSASSWGCELKYLLIFLFFLHTLSASSWGCELKWIQHLGTILILSVSLFVRLWVEISISCSTDTPRISVSLFVRLWVEISVPTRGVPPSCSQPLREAVSWNIISIHTCFVLYCQPLREAVSWNILLSSGLPQPGQSASSWGCELK